MDYTYDVFVSYKRHPIWTPWTRDHFRVLLEAYLTPSLPNDAEIFVDDKIEVGHDWVDTLGESLARSKSLVAIFSGDYFRANWCLHELDLMLCRSKSMTPNPNIIIPVVVHDGENIPPEVRRIQCENFSAFRIAGMRSDTSDYHNFSKQMAQLAPIVATAIGAAPQFDATWLADCKQRFNTLYETGLEGGSLPTIAFRTPRPSPPLTPPRIVNRKSSRHNGGGQ